MQTKTHSFIESCTNILVGYTINIALNAFVFNLYGWEITLRQNLEVGLIFTGVSLARSYVLRRAFTKVTENGGNNGRNDQKY